MTAAVSSEDMQAINFAGHRGINRFGRDLIIYLFNVQLIHVHNITKKALPTNTYVLVI